MTEQEIEKLRAAGFNDAEIRDFAANRPQAAQPSTGAPSVEGDLPEVDVTKPSETLANARSAGVPTSATGPGLAEFGTALGGLASENLGKIALGAGGLGAAYAANQVRQGMQARAAASAAQASAQAAQAQAAMEQARAAQQAAQGLQERFAARQAAQAARAVPAGPQILGPGGQPISTATPGPVVPEPMPAQAANAARGAQAAQSAAGPGNWMQQALQMARQYGPALARAGTLVGGLTYSPELGPAVPKVGRMSGTEINPLTGRPWTREQIAQYEANPDAYDRQLPPPQFRR